MSRFPKNWEKQGCGGILQQRRAGDFLIPIIMIHAVIVMNTEGKLRLSKFYDYKVLSFINLSILISSLTLSAEKGKVGFLNQF